MLSLARERHDQTLGELALFDQNAKEYALGGASSG